MRAAGRLGRRDYPPQVRFEGQPGEQWTMFFLDPFGNPIEVKGLRSFAAAYAT